LAHVLSETVAVALIVIRKPGEMQVSPCAFAIAFLGTALPLFSRAGAIVLIPPMASLAIMIGGVTINVTAKFALNRSFGLVVVSRGIKRGGRIVWSATRCFSAT
jgi:hypothetical protein